MSFSVNWADIMYSMMNSGGPDNQPEQNNSPEVCLFFLCFIIFGAFFMTNLFIGVIIQSYNKEKDLLGKNFLLTDAQKNWINTKILIMKIAPKICMVRPETGYRAFVYDFVSHRYFEYFILVVISLNTCTLTFKWVGID